MAGHPVPAGTTVYMSPYMMHRREDLWPDPERFDPERFGEAQSRPKYHYMPFGGGARVCLGLHFSMLEAVLCLATICRRGAPSVPEADLDRVASLEASLLEAIGADDADRVALLVAERDGLVRELAPTLDALALESLVRQDADFRAEVTAARDRVAADIEGLRTGRRASQAYAETASA